MSRAECTCNESYTCASCEREIDREIAITALVERVDVLERKVSHLLETLRQYCIDVVAP